MLCADVANSMPDRWTDELTLTHPYPERKSCSKSGYIPPCGLGGDSVMDRWTDTRWKNNVALAHPYHEGKSYSKLS